MKSSATKTQTDTAAVSPAAIKLTRHVLAVMFMEQSEANLRIYIAHSTGLSNDVVGKSLNCLIDRSELDRISSGYFTERWYLCAESRMAALREIRAEYDDSQKEALLGYSLSAYKTRWDTDGDIKTALSVNLARALLHNTHIAGISNPMETRINLDAPVRPLIIGMLEDPAMSDGFNMVTEDMPVEILWELSKYSINDVITGDWDIHYDDFRELVRRNKTITENQRQFLMEKLSLLLCAMRGDFENPGFDADHPATFPGNLYAGTVAYLRQDWNAAVRFWRQAIKIGQKKWLPQIYIFDVLYVIALKKSGGKLNLKTLDAIDKNCTTETYSNCHAFRLILDSFYGRKIDKTLKDDALSSYNLGDTMHKYTTYAVLKAMGLLEGASEHLKKVGKELESDRDYALINIPGLIPYEQKADWEWAVENIVTKLGYGAKDRKPASKPAEPSSKIVYLISKSLTTVQPVLKKSKDGVIWTAGRNIALKTFATGIPEMSQMDRLIANEVRYYDGGWYGGKYYSLDAESIMPMLVGYNDVYMLENPDVRIEIASDDPYLTTVRNKEGKISFHSNVDIDYVDGGCVIRKEKDTLYKVIKINSRQENIISTLKDISFPGEAIGSVKQLIGYISKDIVVHTDLVKDSSVLSNVKCDSRITVTLMPSGGGLRLDFYVKPFGNVPPYFTPGKGCPSVITHIDDKAVQTERNLRKELDNLSAVHLAIDKYVEQDRDGNSICQSPSDSLMVLDALRLMGDSVHTEWPEGAKFRIVGACDLKDVHIQLKSRTDWFEVGGTMQVSDTQVLEMFKVLEMLRSSEGRFIRIGENEFIALSAKLKQQLDNLSSVASGAAGDNLRVPRVALPVIGEMDKSGVNVKEDAAAKRMLKSIEEAGNASFSVPQNLKAELRSYQEDGYKWMCRLASWGAGACLADDMGLGKTVQTIALMLSRAEQGPSLVVAPASVVTNWEREIIRFAPSMTVSTTSSSASGDRGRRIKEAAAYSVVLTTYGVLVSDRDLFVSRQWSTVVLDEAHVIKNKETKSAAACYSLKADCRVILTGTPLQNNLGEIWSLFQFINPGYLGSYNEFSQKFLQPIEERHDKQAQNRLKKMLLPFMLRRTKSDVLDELPQKTEQTIFVELSDTEKALYESLRRNAELMVEERQANLVQTLAEILKLRQAACCPALVREGLPRVSSKLDELLELVDNIVSGGHKALVFSQFTSYLSIIKDGLDKAGVQYEYLDGSTPVAKRPAIVKAFQTGSAPLFLISLKAGGLGLNLTAADYIIHTDPWWNPSVEDQASDRAYRIGQTRPVTIYKLIARDTIEEKMLEMHRDKRSLADSLLEGSDISSGLTKEELLNILKG